MEQLWSEPTISNLSNVEPGWRYDRPLQASNQISAIPGMSWLPPSNSPQMGENRLTSPLLGGIEGELSAKPVSKMQAAAAAPIEKMPVVSPQRNQNTSQDKVERLTRENKDISGLYNIGVAVGTSLSLEEVVWKLYKESRRLVDTTNFAIVIFNEQTDTLNFSLVFDNGRQLKPFSLKHSSNRGLTSQVLARQAPVLVPNLVESQAMVEIGQAHPNGASQATKKLVRSWLGVPILNPTLTDENAQGAIITWSNEPNAFTERELWLLSAIGTQAAIAIRNARLFEASQRRATEMAVINDMARTLASTLNLEEVLTRIMDQVEAMLKVEAGFLLLTDPSTGDLIFQIALGHQARQSKPFRIPRGRGIAGQVALTGQPQRATDKEGLLDFQARNILCAPLILHEQVIGVIEVINKNGEGFTQQDLTLLESIASFAAIAIENARLHENVLAERDRVIEAEAQTRKALAGNLHDGPIQQVAGMLMRLEFCQMLLEKDPPRLAQELLKTKTLGEQAVHQMRTTLFELRPLILETDGLEAVLRAFLESRQKDMTAEKSPCLTLKIETNQPDGHISRQESKVEAAIFAIVQETVNNAIKHAQASKIVVHLKETHTGLHTTIADDGRGFDVDQVMKHYAQRGSLGMINIRERAELIGGELAIESASGQGTQIRLYVPKAKAERLQKRGKTGRLSLPPELLENKSIASRVNKR
jgi:signal transduction histidine kinase